MDTERMNFSCATCHDPQRHEMQGSRYDPWSGTEKGQGHTVHVTCLSCHERDLHQNEKINDHIDRVACVTCHIPHYARAEPTVRLWDWSQAGETGADGEVVREYNDDDLLTYDTTKGAFAWEQNAEPDYIWFNGDTTYMTLGTPMTAGGGAPDSSQPVAINEFHGSYEDQNARLVPVRRFRGVQPYDTENNVLVAVHLAGGNESAYWNALDWDAAIEAGMDAAGLEYSGNYDFVETEMAWLLNHSIAPAEQALRCNACHSRNGRLQSVEGGYIPGRDRSIALDVLGWLMVGVSLVGVIGHGSLRVVASQRQKKESRRKKRAEQRKR
jgi:hypothetical protein